MSASFSSHTLDVIVLLFIIALGLLVATILVLYVLDVTQNTHAIRRNYPVIGRFRYYFEHIGTFFRQYFYAMDREEQPFNRALRTWIYRAAKNKSPSIAFGSTRDLSKPNTPIFCNAAYPILDDETTSTAPPLIGPHCAKPYQPSSYFNISGMSYGALSKVAVEALSRGSTLANCWLNTGEGGLSPYHLAGSGDLVFQIGTAYYGVRDENGQFCETRYKELAANPQIKMFELKLSQGAKPGKGGILPGVKVTADIAKTRGIPAAQDSISPNRHPQIQSDEKLLDFVEKLKKLSGKPVGIKFVLGNTNWITELCQCISSRPKSAWPDFITLDSGDGGTGAAPQALMDFVGLPIDVSLPVVHRTLQTHKLNNDIRLVVSGKLVTPSYAAWAMCEGADYVVSARGFMFALGCIQSFKCDQNTCPTGVTTHDLTLQKGLDPREKSIRVKNYHYNMIKNIEMIAHSCGLSDASLFSSDAVTLIHSTNAS